MTFPERFKAVMKERGSTCGKLHIAILEQNKSKYLKSGTTSSSALHGYANGDRSPTIRTVEMIARALGVDAAYLAFEGGIYKNKLDQVYNVIDNADQVKVDYPFLIKTIIDKKVD